MYELILQINHLSKSFGSNLVLKDIDFSVSTGDVISIIGASGSGKSTLLRCINLLETPTSGEILYHGKNVLARGTNAPEYRSHVGMVFQSFNLFNNMTVLENCMAGQMKVLKRSKEDARTHAMQYLANVFAPRESRHGVLMDVFGQGVMITGIRIVDGKRYYFNDDGSMHTGWKKISSNYYYFQADGSAAVSTKLTIGGVEYTFDQYGRSDKAPV